MIATTYQATNASIGATFPTVPIDITGSFTQTGNGGGAFRFADPTNAYTLTLAATTTFTTRGVLVTANSAGGTITGGFFRPNRASGGATYMLNVIQNSANDFTIASPIGNSSSSVGALVKSGPGRLILTNATSGYSGGTTINGGTLSISANGNLGGVATAAAVALNTGTLEASANLSLDNAGANLRAVTLSAGGGGLAATAGNTLTVPGVISGSGLLTKSGAGTVVLTGANTHTAGTSVNAGGWHGQS